MECKVDIKAKNDKKDADWNISRMECKVLNLLNLLILLVHWNISRMECKDI